MELFTVKRYDETTATAQDPEKENEILKKLLKKVEKKKRKIEEIYEEIKTRTADAYPSQDENANSNEEIKKIIIEDEKPDTKVESDVEEKPQESQPSQGFEVLGGDIFRKKRKIDVVLPSWLSHPTIIATKLSDSHAEEGIESLPFISEQTKLNLKKLNIEKLFPVQKEVIPWILDAHTKPPPFRPRDICVSAPTGSGKTLAFAVPIIELLSKRIERKIRALVVLPVNELALQVFKVFKSLTHGTNLSIGLLSKAHPLTTEQYQLIEEYKGKYFSKVDVVITTPGRLVEHLHATRGFCLNSLKFLVIDEADKVMAQIHHNWLYHLDNHVKSASDMILSGRSAGLCINELQGEAQKQPHKLLFSATLSQDPEKLQNLKLFQPKLFTSLTTTVQELTEKMLADREENLEKEVRGEFIGKYTTPDELTEKYCLTEARLKPLTLYSLILQNKWSKFLCFTNSALGAHRLAFILQDLHGRNYTIEELSADLTPQTRANIIKRFALGNLNGIVCSDALARGIDIPEVDVVISYDLPRHITTYIHRIGRTARAGRPGTAITMLNANQLPAFQKMLAEAGKVPKNEIIIDDDVEKDNARRYSRTLEKLHEKLETEQFLKKKKKNEVKHKAANATSELSAVERLQLTIGSDLKVNTI